MKQTSRSIWAIAPTSPAKDVKVSLLVQMMEGAAANGSAREADSNGAQPAGPVDADEDIFGEAGRDFVPDMPSTNGTLPLRSTSKCTLAEWKLTNQQRNPEHN